MKLEELAKVKEGAHLVNILPEIAQEIAGMEEALEARAMSLMNLGQLTPELALHFWVEKAAYRRILKRFEQRVKISTSTGEKVAVELNEPHIMPETNYYALDWPDYREPPAFMKGEQKNG